MEKASITIAQTADTELQEAFARLLPQLSRSAAPLTAAQLQEIVTTPGNDVFVARVQGRIVGTLTLVHFRIPTGVRAWIEDVVVDGQARGSGAGQALVLAAVARARELGARTLDLTSNPAREAAHRLYEKTGFALRDTRVYRHAG
ncbi:GNAT family N-acetyltransferase [Bordetella hinzii]|uniref:N-acetyltransferase n=2 Tax=Bordetella hinzii TaxID=103855 RepID=A0AAN1VFY4_9BORD|nr:GNAT family N-acetyltransferase [Bordetella hinzii]AKQ57659.1 putative acetyltransferase [Bordetella hinzii]AKQ62125.1 putative acetyltransferase [Bordetella hinzii]AZW16962.1 N-acetyltransferase [Bordetella hinzii]KCB23593.1 acetyltransferase (GNAT) domain protein [Bordetella hinzii OH87 BAL007II]KCB31978.1 acetyltransferase (GNAT) domain protein [Bordetella hinzii CA90 BAL1384]